MGNLCGTYRKERNMSKLLTAIPVGKTQLENDRYRDQNNIKIDFKE
jgi:hypothetical protein